MDRLNATGFSLTELLIALAIVAILATITVPSYTGFVAKSRRADAMAALAQAQLAQERWRSGNSRYAPDLATLGWTEPRSPDGHYSLRVERAERNVYRVVAQPLGSQRNDDCGRFAVDQNGPLHEAGFADRRCWNR